MPENGKHFEYPARPPVFALKAIRWFVKTAAANDVGPAGFALFATIASTEDEKRYRGFVTFHNQQLLPLIGVNSVDALDRVRKKLVESGLLHYEPPPRGSRSPGRYCVTPAFDEPESNRTSADTSQNEDVDEPETVRTSADTRPNETQKEPGSVRTGADQTRFKRGSTAEHSTLPLSLSPKPISTTTTTEEKNTAAKTPTWGVVGEILKKNGVKQPTRAIESAKAREMSPPDVLELVNEWLTQRHLFDNPAAVLYARLRELDSWPPPSDAASRRAAEEKRIRDAEADQAKWRKQAEERERRAAAIRSRPRFDELPRDEQELRIDQERERYPGADARMLRRYAAAHYASATEPG